MPRWVTKSIPSRLKNNRHWANPHLKQRSPASQKTVAPGFIIGISDQWVLFHFRLGLLAQAPLNPGHQLMPIFLPKMNGGRQD